MRSKGKLIAMVTAAAITCAAKPSEMRTPPVEPPIAVSLTRVIDGNTFVAGLKTIRLWGIEPPPSGNPHQFAAKLYLQTLLEAGAFICDFKGKDNDGSLVMRCTSESGDVAASLVRMGVARDLPQESDGYYLRFESLARESNYGIWGKDPISTP